MQLHTHSRQGHSPARDGRYGTAFSWSVQLTDSDTLPSVLSHLACQVGIFVACAIVFVSIGYIVFLATNTGRCVDLRNGIEFNTSFIRTEKACEDYGFTWVYEPFSDDDPRRRYDPLLFQRDRVLQRIRDREIGY